MAVNFPTSTEPPCIEILEYQVLRKSRGSPEEVCLWASQRHLADHRNRMLSMRTTQTRSYLVREFLYYEDTRKFPLELI